MFSKLDLPEPEGPMIATNSPLSTERLISSRATVVALPKPYILETSSSFITFDIYLHFTQNPPLFQGVKTTIIKYNDSLGEERCRSG